MTSKVGPLYADYYIGLEQNRGKRFTEKQKQRIKEQWAGIYLHHDQKRFVAIANLPYVDAKTGKKKYRRPSKVFTSLQQAQEWLDAKRVEANLGMVQAPPTKTTAMNAQAPTATVMNVQVPVIASAGNGLVATPMHQASQPMHAYAYQSGVYQVPNALMSTAGPFINPHPHIIKSSVTLAEASAMLLQEKERDKQKSIHDTKRYHQRIIDYFGGDIPLEGIGKEQVFRFRQYIQNKNKESCGQGKVTSATVNRYLAALRHLLNWAEDEQLVANIPKVKLLKVPSTRKELEIDLADYLCFVDHLPGLPKHHKAMALLALNTATRWSDASTFTYGQITKKLVKDGDKMVRQVHIEYRSSKTRSGWIAIPILDVTKNALEDFLQYPTRRNAPDFLPLDELIETKLKYQSNTYIFLNTKTKKPFTSMKTAMESAVKRAGIPRITFHDIRRLMTTIIIEETGDYGLAQQIGRWSNQAMREHYTSLGKRPRIAFSKVNSLINDQVQSGRAYG